MQILIIGGTRFIGPYLVSCLLEKGHRVTVFHRGQTKAELPPEVGHIQGDRSNLADFVGEFKRLAPQVVIDMIPYTEQEAVAVMHTFKGIVQRVVAVSSMDVYLAYDRLRRVDSGPPGPLPLTEDAPLRQVLYPYRSQAKVPDDWVYNYEKILVEQIIMSDSEIPGTILRLPALYGPGDYQHRMFEYLKRMDEERPAILLNEVRVRWRWTRGYVENVAAAIALAAADERALGRIYNVGEEEALTEMEWVQSIGRAAGWDGEVIAVPEDQLPNHLKTDFNWEHDCFADTSRIREELEYNEPVSRDEALRRTVAWERAHPFEEVNPDHFDYSVEDAVLARLRQHGKDPTVSNDTA